MKRHLLAFALLFCAGGSHAALLQSRAALGNVPLLQVPVTGPRVQAASTFSASLAAPSLRPVWSAAPSPLAPADLSPSALSSPHPALSQAPLQPEIPTEELAAQASARFDAALPRPLRLIITGPPGSGKGTYSEKISQDYGMPHISVGELLRDYARTRPAVAAVMSRGQLVDSRLVLEVVRERLAQPDVREHGFILDGFPRRNEEAAALEGMLGASGVDGVIELRVPEGELLRRILARGRADDRPDVFRERMRIYREQTVPALERFKAAAPVVAPEVSGPLTEANYARLKADLAGLVRRLIP